jgi:hypothetical protein
MGLVGSLETFKKKLNSYLASTFGDHSLVGEGAIFSKFSYHDLGIHCKFMAPEAPRGLSILLFLHYYVRFLSDAPQSH